MFLGLLDKLPQNSAPDIATQVTDLRVGLALCGARLWHFRDAAVQGLLLGPAAQLGNLTACRLSAPILAGVFDESRKLDLASAWRLPADKTPPCSARAGLAWTPKVVPLGFGAPF